jgi:hypothetical protein
MAIYPDNVPGHADIATETRLVRVEAGVEHLQETVRDMKADIREMRGEMHGGNKDLRGEMGELRGEMGELRKQARDDFRILFASLITTALGLSGLMAKGFHWL